MNDAPETYKNRPEEQPVTDKLAALASFGADASPPLLHPLLVLVPNRTLSNRRSPRLAMMRLVVLTSLS